VPSFPEALGRRLKRSISRPAALALAEAAGGGALHAQPSSASRRRQGPASPSRSRGGGGNNPGAAPGGGGGGGGGGFLGCCMGPAATGGGGGGGDRATTPTPVPLSQWVREADGSGNGTRKADGDRTVRGGGYGPSVRGGAAYLGAVADSRRPSSEVAAAGLAPPASGSPTSGATGGGAAGLEGSQHSAGSALAAPGGRGPADGSTSRPCVRVLHTVDVGVLLGHLPPAPCDLAPPGAAGGGGVGEEGAAAAAAAAAAPWLTATLRAELRHLLADAHRLHGSRSGHRVVATLAPAKAGHGHGDGNRHGRRTGLGPTPVVVVPPVNV